jgi:predicted Zn-dependent peptidase
MCTIIRERERNNPLLKKTTLDNGLRVISQRMKAVRSVSICVLIGTGSRYEKDEIAGVSHFIEHLMFRGTQKRPESRDISEAIEGIGGILNGGTDKEVTVYWCKVAQDHFPLAMDLMADILLHSKFDQKDMEKERRVIIEEINMSHDSPTQRVNQLIDGLLWPDHPLGRDIAGSKQSVSAITRNLLVDYMNLQYIPANTIISVAGNIEHKKVLNIVDRLLGGWYSEKNIGKFITYKRKTNPRLYIEKRDIEQVHLCLALPGLSIFHPQRFNLDLLNVILGEGMSSRLFCEIRDRLGLAYSINSYVEHLSDTGALVIYAAVEPRKLEQTIQVILQQLSLLAETLVSEEELNKGKEIAKGRLLLQLEDSRNLAGWLGGQEVLTNQILDIDEVISIISDIKADTLKRVAQDLFKAKQLRMSVVGPVIGEKALGEILTL